MAVLRIGDPGEIVLLASPLFTPGRRGASEARQLDGSFDIDGTLCIFGGSVDGAIDDRKVSFTIDNGSGRIELEGTLNLQQDRIEGTWDVVGGACSGTHGSFHVER